MIKSMGAALAAAMMLTAGAQAASTVGYSLIEGSGGVTGAELAGDGVFPADWTGWTTDSAWWQGTAGAVTFSFDNAYTLTGLKLTVDNNDVYRVFVSKDGVSWSQYATVFDDDGVVGGGQETFTMNVVTTGPGYRFARVTAKYGDGMYSVGEVQFSGIAAVPEPASAALMFAGLAGVGLLARRRRIG